MSRDRSIFSLRAPALLLALLVALPVAAAAETKTLKGSLAYRERIALPPNAVAEVSLVDVARADAPLVIGQTRVSPAGQPPIPWEINYDPGLLTPHGRYALQARISVDGELWFVAHTRNPAGGPDKMNLVLHSARQPTGSSIATHDYLGRWLAEDIGGGGVIDRIQTTLEIGDDGRIAGSGGCNRYFGNATVKGEALTFSPLGSTQMACPPAVMDQEAKFLAMLREVRSWRYDAARRKLTLVDAQGKAVAVLARM